MLCHVHRPPNVWRAGSVRVSTDRLNHQRYVAVVTYISDSGPQLRTVIRMSQSTARRRPSDTHRSPLAQRQLRRKRILSILIVVSMIVPVLASLL